MKNFKNILIGFVLMGSFGYASAQNWAGSYMGLQIGSTNISLEHSDSTSTEPFSVNKKDASKILGGLYFGHNFQWNQLVLGPELEFSLGKSKFDNNGWEAQAGAADNCNWCSYEISNSARLRLRAGYVYEKSTLLFLTSGLAMAKYSYTDLDPAGLTASPYGGFKGKLNGLTFGAGIEHAFHRNLSLRAEYIRDQYKSEDFTVPADGLDPFLGKVKTSMDTLRVGLTYKF